ncbi:MAG: hypothetical protein P4L86_28050, partial [Mycobacterium sp.]|nr:hypothetical protein [Mycobacterium sp.]
MKMRPLAGKVALAAASVSLAVIALPIFSAQVDAAAGTDGSSSAVPLAPLPPAPLFTECPAIGADTGCGFLITLPATGPATIQQDTNQGPYDGNDDTLVGIVNNTGVPIPTVGLSSNTDIFGFDGDGICSSTYRPDWTAQGSGGCNYESSGYGGPKTLSYTNISSNKETGNVNFTGAGLAAGTSTFFSLESSLNGANFTIPASFTVTKSFTPSAGVIAGSGTPIVYTLTATNHGQAEGNVTVTDTVPTGTTLVSGSYACPTVTSPTTCAVVLSGSTITWTLTNVAGGASVPLNFSVTANGTDPTELIPNAATWTGPGCSSSPCSTNTVNTPVTAQSPSLSVAKATTTTSVSSVGVSIPYSYTVTNTSNVTLTNVGVTDLPISPAGLTSSPVCTGLTSPTASCTSSSSTTLAPGQVAHFTASYSVTQADLNNGSIKDTASAT